MSVVYDFSPYKSKCRNCDQFYQGLGWGFSDDHKHGHWSKCRLLIGENSWNWDREESSKCYVPSDNLEFLEWCYDNSQSKVQQP